MNLKNLIFGGNVAGTDGRNGSYSGSIQEWLPIQNIVQGMVVTKDRRFVKILEVLPVNFYLKSELERKNIIFSYASYLKIAPDSLQIRIVTQKADMEHYVEKMRGYCAEEPNEQCRAMIEDNAVLELLYELINKKTARRVKLPSGVFDMLTQVHGVYE